jgi:hypothetical protein
MALLSMLSRHVSGKKTYYYIPDKAVKRCNISCIKNIAYRQSFGKLYDVSIIERDRKKRRCKIQSKQHPSTGTGSAKREKGCDLLIQQYGLAFSEAADVLNRTGMYLYVHSFYALAEPLCLAKNRCGYKEHSTPH